MEIQEEIWMPVNGYEGIYEISNLGNVKSLGRYVAANRGGVRYVKEHLLSLARSKNGYYAVVLSMFGKRKMASVYRLVAESFIPNPNHYKEVNHKDENKHNNNVLNLEWCDRKYNANYGTGVERCARQKWKPVIMIDSISNLPLQTFPSAREAEKMTGVSYKCISLACNGKTKCAGGYRWKFKEEK